MLTFEMPLCDSIGMPLCTQCFQVLSPATIYWTVRVHAHRLKPIRGWQPKGAPNPVIRQARNILFCCRCHKAFELPDTGADLNFKQ